MAATITQLASGTRTSGSSSVSTGSTVTATAADKDWLVVLVAALNAGTSNHLGSVTDSAGNTYTQRATGSFSGPDYGGAIGIYTTAVTADISGGQITCGFSPNATVSAIHVYRFRPGAGETGCFASAGVSSVSFGSHSTGAVSVTSGHTIFGMAGVNRNSAGTGDSDTTNGSWSSLFATNANGSFNIDVSAQSQYKTVNATGDQTWTLTASGLGIAGYLVLRSEGGNQPLEALAGSYTVTGTAASSNHGWKLAASGGSYAVSGTDVSLNKGKTLTAAAGSYSVTGTAASLLHGWKIAAGAGSYAVIGTDVALIKEGKNVDADPGSYTVTGTAVTFVKGRKIAAAAGSYVVTGTDPALNKGRTLVAGVGSYAVTGTAVSPEHGWKVAAAAGSYTVTGKTAQLLLSSAKFIEAGVGSYLVTGTTVLLDHDEDPEEARGGMPLKMYAPRVHNYVEVTPLVQAAAYDANDVVFVATEVPNASWRTTPGGEEMMVESIAILDEADNAAANWTFYFGRSTFTLGSINGAVNISDSDARLITSAYTLASGSFVDLINSKLGYATNLGLSVIPADGSKSIYVAASCAGTPTFGSTSDIKLKLHLVS